MFVLYCLQYFFNTPALEVVSCNRSSIYIRVNENTVHNICLSNSVVSVKKKRPITLKIRLHMSCSCKFWKTIVGKGGRCYRSAKSELCVNKI